LGPNKITLLSSRLSKRRRELGFEDWDGYLAWLLAQGADEIEILIDLVSTNHTHFFREAVQFEILQSELLDTLLARSPSARRGLRCWSAGCSSGEEAFTLAITLAEYAEQKQPDLRWQIEATDISHRALKKAQKAIYEIERLGLPHPGLLKKYFQKGTGPYDGFCKVKPELQHKVQFQRMNLFADSYTVELASQTQLVQRLNDSLDPGGYLIAGHSDSLLRIKHSLLSLGNGIYQRPGSP
jgi:chemotaxis protein methyltransferase CheR